MVLILRLIFMFMVFNCTLQAVILPLDSIAHIESIDKEPVLYLLDIDDTLIDYPCMLGSRPWRAYIKKQGTSWGQYQWHDQFSLYLACTIPITTVESFTNTWISRLQSAGHIVLALTSRERAKWYDTPFDHIDQLTIAQLKSVGIHLNSEAIRKSFPLFTQVPQYYEGVFFADIEPKGEFLRHLFLETLTVPKKVIFIDDKWSQVESVHQVLEEFKIEHICYWYRATEEKEKIFDPLIANIQLYTVLKSQGTEILTDEEAFLYSLNHRERNADYYLEEIYKAEECKHKAVPSKKEECFDTKAHHSL